jgi:uncharacterized membrane protein
MRHALLLAVICLACSSPARASGSFVELQTPSLQITKIASDGAYAVGSFNSKDGRTGVRWVAESGAEQIVDGLNVANGINNAGAIAGAVPADGGSINGGHDLGAFAALTGAPGMLTIPLDSNSNGYDIADDGSVVGLSFDDAFSTARAFVWTAAEGMMQLPVNRPGNYSRANAISADGHVIVGWNDQDNGDRTAVVWRDRVPTDIVDDSQIAVGEASAVTADGSFVVGSSYYDKEGNSGSWRWDKATGSVTMIPNMPFAFGVSADGHTVVGNSGFFDNPPRAPMIWHEGVGTQLLIDYLAQQGIAVPPDWNLSGGLDAISGDGMLLGGWAFGPLGQQSYLIKIDETIFADGFEATVR